MIQSQAVIKKIRQKTVIRKLLQRVTEVYYKVHRVLQSVTEAYYKVCQVLQSASGITKYDRLLLQSASGITKCDSYYIVRRNSTVLLKKNKPLVDFIFFFFLSLLHFRELCYNSTINVYNLKIFLQFEL